MTLYHTILIVPGIHLLPCFPTFIAITTFSMSIFYIKESQLDSDNVGVSLFHYILKWLSITRVNLRISKVFVRSSNWK